MAALTYRAEPGVVFVADGPRESAFDEAQVNRLLDIFEEGGLKTAFNSLYEAGQAAGFIPRVTSFRPVLVVENPSPGERAATGIVRDMLRRSRHALGSGPEAA